MTEQLTTLALLAVVSLSGVPETYYNPQAFQCVDDPTIVEIVVEEPPEEVKEKPSLPAACSCIASARELGVPIPLGTNAEDITPNSPPREGGLVLLDYDGLRHVAVIKELGERLGVCEGNYKSCRYTCREIDFDDPHIVGYAYF